MSGAILEPMKTTDLPRVWPVIRPKIEELRAKFGEQWMVEHVFYEIMQGGTYLWTTPDLRGFVILQILATPYARDLHIWIAANETGAGVHDFHAQLNEIAAENGCGHITWESDRRGWKRAFPGARVRQHYSLPVGG